MNFNFAKLINKDLEKLAFEKAISKAEMHLNEIPKTPFHEIIGKSLTKENEELAIWIEIFFTKVATNAQIKSLYFEMNEFDINTDLWYIEGFAYTQNGGLNDMEWFTDFQFDTQTKLGEVFEIKGFKKFQQLFENIEELEENDQWSDEMQDARDWCEQIIIARFMELMRATHVIAKQKNMKWAHLPVYFTEHAYNFVVKSEV